MPSYRSSYVLIAVSMFIVGALYSSVASGANFVEATYDESTDELVVKVAYRGTNPSHEFSLQWDQCQDAAADGTYQISARVIDSQWNDRARRDFEKVVRFPLNDLRCRPATVTLFTAPDFQISVTVPALGDAMRRQRGPRTDAQ
jgi:hypothetical protein